MSDAPLVTPPATAPKPFADFAPGGSAYTPTIVAWQVLSTGSAAVCAYHGYKRNNSIGWALVWGFLGGIFFPVAPAIAVAQGLGKRAGKR